MTILSITQIERGPAVTPTGMIQPSAIAIAAPYGTPGPRIFGTSDSSVAITDTGPKTFIINEYGRSFSAGVRVRATAIPSGNWMEGVVTSYDEHTRTLTFTADLASGSGTFADWNINVAGEQGEKGETGATGPIGPSGGPVGPAGPGGANAGVKYTFNSGTSGDPGTGKFLLNNSNLTLATTISISEVDGAGMLQASMLAVFDDGTSGHKSIVRFITPDGLKGIFGYVTGALTDHGNYDTYPWTPVASWGAPTNDIMYLTWDPVGDKGDKGDLGGTFADAPSDGTTYGRKDAAWAAVVASTAASVPVTPAGGIASTDVQAALQELDSEKVAKAGDIMAGNLTIRRAGPIFGLDRTDALPTAIQGLMAGLLRWQVVPGDNIAEAGGNSGSNFLIARANDAGVQIDTPISIDRASGIVTASGQLNYSPQTLTTAQQDQARKNIFAAPFDSIGFSGLQVNGAMEVSQELGSTVLTVPVGSASLVDQWVLVAGGSASLNGQQGQFQSPNRGGVQKMLAVQTLSPQTIGASNIIMLMHPIEGDRAERLSFGLAVGIPVTVCFLVAATIPGQAALTVRNFNGTRCYVAPFAITAGAMAQQFVSITIPPDVAGGGLWTVNNTIGMQFVFSFGVGTTNQTATPNTWVSATVVGTPTTTNFFASANNQIYLTAFGAYPGNAAPRDMTEYARTLRGFEGELRTSQRYWESSYDYGMLPGTTAGGGGGRLRARQPVSDGTGLASQQFKVTKRIAPTIVFYSDATGAVGKIRDQANGTDVPANTESASINTQGFSWYGSASAGTNVNMSCHYTANARLI